MNDLVAERYEVFELMPQYNDAMYQKIQSQLPQLPGGTISQIATGNDAEYQSHEVA